MLIRGLSIHGKDKLADKWENDLHIVVDQPDDSIPVFIVEPIGGGVRRTLHRNVLLPVSLPLLEGSPQICRTRSGFPKIQPKSELGPTRSDSASSSDSEGFVVRPSTALNAREDISVQGSVRETVSSVSQSSSSSEVVEPVESDVSNSDQSLLSPGDDASSDVQSSVFELSELSESSEDSEVPESSVFRRLSRNRRPPWYLPDFHQSYIC